MRVCVFASGSSGNCMLLSGGGANLLIDAGISARRIVNSLASMHLTMDDISGVLITHEHSDHVSGLKTLIKNHNVKLYAPRTVANRLAGMLPETQDVMTHIPVGESFMIAQFNILAFHTPHDTDESVGYRIERDGIFAMATDMGHVSAEVEKGLLGADTVLIESNHDEMMLRYGPYPVYLKRRILSERGHLSNDDCACFIRRLAESGTKQVILGHLSRENNSPAKAMSAASAAAEDYDLRLFCAPVLGQLSVQVGNTGELEQCLL